MARDERKALRRKYASLYEEVESILFRHDPVEIAFEDNTDEYDPEVSTILPRAYPAETRDEVLTIVRDEFLRWFAPQRIFRQGSFEQIADEVFEAISPSTAIKAHPDLA